MMSQPRYMDDTDVNQFKAKPDHSYSVMDKPKFAHREKHENKVPLPYPLKGDHEYVRGKPNTKEIIVSRKDIILRNYHPRMRIGNNFTRVCLSVFLCVYLFRLYLLKPL